MNTSVLEAARHGVRAIGEYSNLATIIGAGQTPIREVRSTDEETDIQREQLAAWRAGLDEALLVRGVSVDVGRRSLTR